MAAKDAIILMLPLKHYGDLRAAANILTVIPISFLCHLLQPRAYDGAFELPE